MMIDLSFFALTFDVLGKLMIAYAALQVHRRVLHEHTIDAQVFRTMKREQILGIAGALFIVIAYIVEIGLIT